MAHSHYDVAVIGTGVSSCYCTYLLSKCEPPLRVCVFETSLDIGGRHSAPGARPRWVRDTFWTSSFVPAQQPTTAAIVDALGVETLSCPQDKRKSTLFFSGAGKPSPRSSVKIGANAMSPVDMVNYAIERYFTERPNEKRDEPLSSALLSSISTRDLLKLYFPEKDADLCLAYFGLSGCFPDTVSASSFVQSWHVRSASPEDTRLLPGGTKELSKNLLQASGTAVEVKLGHKLVSVAAGPKTGSVSLTMSVISSDMGEGEGAAAEAAEAAAAAESAAEQKSSSQRRITNAEDATTKSTETFTVGAVVLSRFMDDLHPEVACSVNELATLRLFLKFEAPWWALLSIGLGKSTTSTTIETVEYLEDAVLMIGCSGANAEKINDALEKDLEAGVNLVMQQLRMMHGFAADDSSSAPAPPSVGEDHVYVDYKALGLYSWAKGSDAKNISRSAQRCSIPGVYVCCDALSPQPGSVEGGLLSAEALMVNFGAGASIMDAVSCDISEFSVGTVRTAIKHEPSGVHHVAVTSKGRSPLHAAAAKGYTSAVEALLEAGADVDATDFNGVTALHLACENGHAPAVQALLAYGASVTVKESSGATPGKLARQGGTKEHKAVLDVLSHRHLLRHWKRLDAKRR